MYEAVGVTNRVYPKLCLWAKVASPAAANAPIPSIVRRRNELSVATREAARMRCAIVVDVQDEQQSRGHTKRVRLRDGLATHSTTTAID